MDVHGEGRERGGSAGVCYLDLYCTQTFSLCVSDGSSQQLGGCLRDFRNKPFPVRVRVEYYQQALTVSCLFYLCGMLQASPHCQFYLCVLQASPHRKFCLSVLPGWSTTGKPLLLSSVCFTCVECCKQALSVSSVSRSPVWSATSRPLPLSSVSQFHLCEVLPASPHHKFSQFYLCGALQASPHHRFCQFYLCGVLQASPHHKFSQSVDHLRRVLLATPTVNSVSRPVIHQMSCIKTKQKKVFSRTLNSYTVDLGDDGRDDDVMLMGRSKDGRDVDGEEQ